MGTHVDTSEVKKLAFDLDRIPVSALPRVRDELNELGRDGVKLWQAHSRSIDLPHGKHYPRSISHELIMAGLGVEYGPVSALPQGGMGRGFEYGSRNQRPHLSGNHSADVLEPKIPDRMATALMRGVRDAI